MLARLKRRIFSHYILMRRLLTISFFAAILLGIIFLALPFLQFSKGVILSRQSDLKNDNGRTNILILGIGGPEHDGPNLTDTMIVVSATSSGTVSLISIPRDIYLDSLGGKVNTAYAVGLGRGPDVGLILAKAVAFEITGLPIHYAVRIDFSVFEKIVDLLGGIDVVVEHPLDDSQYPIDGRENDLCGGDPQFACRYATVHFEAGPQHLDGATALKFVRSRKAEGSEGTDFARARRQQLVIAAVKEKIFGSGLLLDPTKVPAIYDQLKAHINTDFDPAQTGKLIALGLKFRKSTFKNIVLDLTLLENPPIDDRGWILLPKEGNWAKVHDFIKGGLEKN